jgi:hypothetical protein
MITVEIPGLALSELKAGDRILIINGHRLPAARTVAEPQAAPGGPVRLVNALGGQTVWNLYADDVGTVTVEREYPDPVGLRVPTSPYRPARTVRPADPELLGEAPPTLWPEWNKRERAALRRNSHYVYVLRALDDGQGGIVDLRQMVPALDPARGRRIDASTATHVAGILATWYRWTEKEAAYRYRLTWRGRSVLAAYDASEGKP